MLDGADRYRAVVDEESLALGGLSATELRDALERFADLLEPLADGRQVAIMDLAYEVECWDSVTLADLRYVPDDKVPRDTRVRLALLLDKCRVVAPSEADLPQEVRVDGTRRETSWGMAHALNRCAVGWMTSCLVLHSPHWPSGWISVEHESGRTELHILTEETEIPDFWRGVILRERVSEASFFAMAASAFPGLLLAESLGFHHFRGVYTEVLPWVVRVLAAVDDHFAEVLAEHHGDHNRVISEFSALGIDISPESPKTKKDRKAWAQRNIEYRGREYRCEWHGKRLWDRDRIHFSLPLAEHDGKILIGVFDGHLDT